MILALEARSERAVGLFGGLCHDPYPFIAMMRRAALSPGAPETPPPG